MGTILYMAPEQIKDAKNVGKTADLYSFGVTLYNLLCGKYPFNFPTPREIMDFLMANQDKVTSPAAALRLKMQADKLKNPHMIVLSDEPFPIRERIKDLHPDLAQVVDKSIKKEIKERYTSATAFKADLANVAGKL